MSYYGVNEYDAKMLRRNNNKNKRVDSIDYAIQLEIDVMSNLFISRFKWNLEDFNVSNNYIEKILLYNGVAAAYKDNKLGWIILPATFAGFNVYKEPTKIQLTGFNYTKTVDASKCVIFHDNPTFSVPYLIIRRYAQIVADTMISCEVYAKALKKPLILRGNFDKKHSLTKIMEKLYNNDEFLILDEALLKDDGELTPHFNTSHNSEDLRGLFMFKKSVYDEMLSKLGISAQNIYKAAQETSDEVNKADLMSDLILNMSYECRQKAVEDLQELSGLEITCESLVDTVRVKEMLIENNVDITREAINSIDKDETYYD